MNSQNLDIFFPPFYLIITIFPPFYFIAIFLLFCFFFLFFRKYLDKLRQIFEELDNFFF